MGDKNFITAKTEDEANTVDLKKYTFIKFSDTRDCWMFKKRAGQ